MDDAIDIILKRNVQNTIRVIIIIIILLQLGEVVLILATPLLAK